MLGKATPVQQQAFAVRHEAMEAGIAAVKPGVTAADIARVENDVFRRHGLGEYTTSKYTRVRGHGLGLSTDVKPSLLEDVDIELRPGMTSHCASQHLSSRGGLHGAGRRGRGRRNFVAGTRPAYCSGVVRMGDRQMKAYRSLPTGMPSAERRAWLVRAREHVVSLHA